MKVLDKIILVLFSSIMLIVSALLCFILFGWIKLDIINIYANNLLNNQMASNITLGVLAVLIILSIKGIFFSTDSKKDKDKSMDNGILIENDNGKLLISRDTIQNLVSSVVKEFKGDIVYINIMCNMSVDCDCCGVAEEPCIKDIGILASTDPIAIDQACIDLVKKSDDPGKEHFLERVNSRHGTHTIESAFKLGFGNKEYELIEVK